MVIADQRFAWVEGAPLCASSLRNRHVGRHSLAGIALRGRALLLALLALTLLQTGSLRADDLGQAFTQPPEQARPWTFWYWMYGAVSREAVTAELEAMKTIGLGGAYLVPIKDVETPSRFEPSVRTLTPEWWDLLRYTFSEADRVGIKLAMHVSDGFATAGGPWITPAQAMQKVVWTETQVEGGRMIDEVLAQPSAHEGYYRDIAVLAFPTPEGTDRSTRTIIPKATTSVSGFDATLLAKPGNTQRLRSEAPCWVQYEFEAPFTCRSIVIRPDGANYPALRLIVEVSDDGVAFRSLGRLETPRHGWQDWDADYTFSIKPTTARIFRLRHEPSGAERGAEDLDSAKWSNVFKVRGIELFSAARIPHYEGKSGLVWRRSDRADASLIPDGLCVPREKIIDLTQRLTPGGHLRWNAPAGRWTILRLGHTATGHRNETAGAGRGLECDKFDPAVVRLQFDRWLGETIRQVGPELAGRVLTTLHVDSWEAGSQNWTRAFPAEFERRRGYDLTTYLPAFAGIPVGSAEESERFLYDVRRTLEDLTNDAFFATLPALAKEHHMTFTAETTAPTMMGDGMRHFGNVDVPMGEFWLRSPTQDKPNDIHDAISGAHIYGKPIVMSEAFTERNLAWDEHPGMLKALGDHNYALGINRFLLHVFTHNPWSDRRPGMTLSNIGLYFQRDQTWFAQGRSWIEYLTRCQALLQQGTPVADVVYFTGEEMPARAVLPERRVPSLPAGYTADSINRDALLRLATAKDGRITLPGGASYAVLVLPPTPLMSSAVVAKLNELVAAGATVIGPHPTTVPGIEAGNPDLKARWNPVLTLEEALAARGVAADLLATGPDGDRLAGIDWTHRLGDEGDLYFISNQRNVERTVTLSLRSDLTLPELFDAVTGEIRPAVDAVVKPGCTSLAVALPAHGSVFVVFRRSQENGNGIAPAPGPFGPLRPVEGPWAVTFDPKNGGPPGRSSFGRLSSWSEHRDPAIRFYSGAADYSTTVEWTPDAGTKRAWLDLGRVADIASVRLNGVDCGTVWTAPFRVEITHALRSGVNTLEIRVSNTWANRLLGDQALPSEKRVTWTTANAVKADAPLLPAGLLGPVTLISEK